MPEEWRPITGSEGRYEVSSLGRVKRLFGGRSFSPGLVKTFRNRFRNKLMHVCVRLRINGKKSKKCVHHLVLEAFVGPRPAGLQGLHKDDDHTNNSLTNLYWGTRKDNAADSIRNGRQPQGESHYRAVLSRDQAIAIKARVSSGESRSKLAKEYKISYDNVTNIFLGRTWRTANES